MALSSIPETVTSYSPYKNGLRFILTINRTGPQKRIGYDTGSILTEQIRIAQPFDRF